MRGVILAAGDGGRLRPYTEHCPKVLIPLRDRPLIWYPLTAMATAGITEVGIVVGHKAAQVVEGLIEWTPPGMHLDFIYNPEFAGGNAVSVRTAREFVGYDSFMLAMGDHVIEPSIALRLSAAMGQPSILGVDSAAAADGQLSDATKVLLDDAGYLLRIGKELRHWNAVDIGVFRFEPSVFDTLDQLYDTYGASLELHQLMRCLANQAPGVATCDIEGKFWSDIDTIDDYESADQHIGVSPALSV